MSRMPPPSLTYAGTATTALTVAPSNTALFITNLRLLNLDQLPDWPAITLHTFTTKDANQNQKQRIRCVEWALYRLFELWAPEETRERLQPFFPPLEPLQSLNLRAALYRTLNELKKNGMLGRETTLRKTMLDDCAGPKLLEVLAVFSTNVVKAFTIEEEHHDSLTTATRLATAHGLDDNMQQSLLPLTLAHKASLTALLRRKAIKRDGFESLADYLNAGTHELLVRERNVRQSDREAYPADLTSVEAAVSDSWVGNTNWADTILYGEAPAGDQLLSRPFDEVWRATDSGQSLRPLEDQQALQTRLEQRIQQQKRRVAHWRSFHEKLKGTSTEPLEPRGEEVELRLTFEAHKGLKIGSQSGEAATYEAESYRNNTGETVATGQTSTHHDVVLAMKQQLAAVSMSSCRAAAEGAGKGSNFPARPAAETPRSRLSASFDNLSTPTPQKQANIHPSYENYFTSPDVTQGIDKHGLNGVPGQLGNFGEPAHYSPSTPGTPLYEDEAILNNQASLNAGNGRNHTRSLESPHHADLAGRSDWRSAATPAETQDDDPALPIPASISDDIPQEPATPQLRRLTLAERTRMSMAPRMPQQPDAEMPHATQVNSADEETSAERHTEHSALDRRVSLLDRTRQSMSLLPTENNIRQHKSRKSISAKPAKRASLYPVNQFETPRRAPSLTLAEMSGESDSNQSTPRELMFSGDAEYQSVFRSRPKVALSPIGTPRQEPRSSLDGMAGMEDVGVSSPLARLV